MKRYWPILIIAISLLMLAACGAPAKTTRVAVDQQVDISDNWNDTDLQITAEQIIKQVTSKNWLPEFKDKKGRRPVVIIGEVVNNSSEHIQTNQLVSKIQAELINNGQVDFVASAKERKEIRTERKDQQVNASEDSAKEMGAETGADFMLKGEVTSIENRADGKTLKYFQVNMVLIDLESNRTVWMGDVPIKKLTERSGAKW